MSDQPANPITRNDAARVNMDPERLDQHIKRAQEAIASDKKEVPEFWVNKYKREAAKNWDLFYKRNTNKFFKGELGGSIKERLVLFMLSWYRPALD